MVISDLLENGQALPQQERPVPLPRQAPLGGQAAARMELPNTPGVQISLTLSFQNTYANSTD